VKRTRKSIAPPPTVVPSTRILRKSVAPTVRRSKSPVKKRQSIALPAKPKTTSSSSEMANKRRSTDNLVKKRQSVAVKGKTPEKRRSAGRSENLKRRQSVAVKPKTPEKRRSAGRKSVAPFSRPAATTRQSIMPSTSRRSMMPVTTKAVAPQQSATVTQAELTCEVCKKVFRLKSNLTAHKRLHESNTTKTLSSSLKCSYCDKTFALKTAYDNHLTQYCTKIPSNEKKKLMAASVKSPEDTKNGSSVSNKSGFVPPTKPPAKMHSGIERTPSKTIDCRIDGCNRKFKDPIAYTEHSTHHHSMTSSSGDEK
jgi:Zinc finger, C2H2 type